MAESETKRTLRFIFIICSICALLLSSLASLLATPQEKAKELDRIKQMLLATQLLSYNGHFQIRDSAGLYIPARYDPKKGELVPGKTLPSTEDFFALFASEIQPWLVDDKGDLIPFEQAGIDRETYMQEHQKGGFADLPLKLLYLIKSGGVVIPINGFGLWDAIYGYLALAADGNTVLGTTWYQQAETAGLGANIALPEWQTQFRNKLVFQQSASGRTDLERTPLGITVIKGKVSEVLGSSPKALSSVDGISGASLTGKGVTDAYTDCLAPYRPFLIKLKEKSVGKR